MDGKMTQIQLPDEFVARMKSILGDELPDFIRALNALPCRGIRINPLKRTDATACYEKGEPVQWAQAAYYLPCASAAGATILHEAGAFYLQEPGAMIPAAALNAKPGERILDLCAAPGGKATQAGAALHGQGIIVANEPVMKRAQILSRNIERMGIMNAVVTCAWPDQLARRWPEEFDAVIVDAPCSGEGMFRRVPESRTEWTREKAAGCAERQRSILSCAAGMVRAGGRLVYSTCTYHPEENEENAKWFLLRFPEFEPVPFFLPGVSAPEGFFTCYPHRMKGEGQFTALFRKKGCAEGRLTEAMSLPTPSRGEIKTFRNVFPTLPEPNIRLGSTLAKLDSCPDLSGIKVLRAGLHLGTVRGTVAVPDHACALAAEIPDIRAIDLEAEEACGWLAGSTLDREINGWALMRSQGLVIGWGKGSGGIVRNHYPKGLRGSRYLAQDPAMQSL